MGGCDGAQIAAERSCPTSEVRCRSREDPMPEGQRPRRVTPHPSSGVAGESARLRRRRNGRKELPHVRGQGWQPRGATPCLRSGPAAESARLRQRRSSREKLPLTRLQGRRRGGATPCLRPGAVAKTSNPKSKEQCLLGCRRA